MKIRILAIGDRMPNWVDLACAEYTNRLQHCWPTEIITRPAHSRKHNHEIVKANKEESAWLINPSNHASYTIALDRCGKTVSTIDIAKKMEGFAGTVHFLIGGPEGITPDILKQCNEVWSLSHVTFAHPIARVVLLEQLYRAWSINHHHPYHR